MVVVCVCFPFSLWWEVWLIVVYVGKLVKFYSSVEITLYLLADFLLQYVTLFQSRDIVKNLVSL